MISFTLLLNPRLPGMKWRCCIERYPPICPICRASWLTETTMYAKWINMGKINFDSYNVNIWIASAKHSLLLFRVDLMLCWHKWWGETKNSRNVAMRNKCYVGGIPAAASKSAESVVVIQSMMLGNKKVPSPTPFRITFRSYHQLFCIAVLTFASLCTLPDAIPSSLMHLL